MMIQQIAQQEPLFLFSLLFITGLCIGSFLNVVIYRLPIMLQREWQQEARSFLAIESELPGNETFNLAFPASACPNCRTLIKPWQNIPVLSYLLLRGKCGSCKQTISVRYPLVELFTGVISLLLAVQLGFTAQLLAMLLLSYICIALAGIDYDHQLLPDNLTLPLLWLGLLLNTQSLFVSLHDAVWGAIAGYGILWLVFWGFKLATDKEGMGYGDFKLMAAFGAWFGWQALPNIILLSSLVGAVLGIAMIVLARRQASKPMPFGPFIIIAGWLSVVYPQYTVLSHYL